jgi:hypothetical protein
MTSRQNPGDPVDVATVQLKDCEKWKEFCRTETQWAKAGNLRWVPEKVTMWHSGEHVELVFTNWEFDSKVDVTSLDPSDFIPEGISKTVDFQKWYGLLSEKSKSLKLKK